MQKNCLFGLALAVGLASSTLGTNYHVAQNGQTPGDFKSWETAATNIQDAVNAAIAGDTIYVTNGIYRANSLSNVVEITKSLNLIGCGPRETVIIDGEKTRRGIYFFSTTTTGWLLDGFTISNCYALGKGGGIYVVPPSGPTLRMNNCILVDNEVETDGGTVDGGGGLYSYASNYRYNLTISNCVFRNNKALLKNGNSTGGGAILRVYIGTNTIVDTTFDNNRSSFQGGGLALDAGNHILERCVFVNNAVDSSYVNSAQGGGAVYINATPVDMRNCLLHHNSAINAGGGINSQARGSNGWVNVYNCTIVSNTSGGGAGIHFRSWSVLQGYQPSLRLENSIVYGNTVGVNLLLATSPGKTNLVYNSCFTPETVTYLPPDASNIHVDPMFVDALQGDYRLGGASPCLNTGTNQTWMIGTIDLDGKPRIDRLTGQVDMGCYEKVALGTTIMIR